ncbi:MAG TPA: hypothetical protein ENJ20_05905 [Bacteroidetes bacterium]|nr:hypothetical protein [Bacteroidota bacterium]
MGNVAEKIRNHIGNGELAEAIDVLNNYLKPKGGNLYNQAIHLKGRYKEYMRNRDLGLSDDREEKSRISMAILNMASEIENQNLEHTPSPKEFEQHKPRPSDIARHHQPPPYSAQPPKYIAQCLFTMDTMQYFLADNGQIFMVNPFNNQTMLVGMKMPPQNPNYAWILYFTTTNIYYLVDHAGIIWGQNYGMPAQFGTVRYL